MRLAVQLENVWKIYNVGRPNEFPALRGIDLEVERGEVVALMGPSGSGKTTLLNLLGCLDTATSGRVLVEGVDVCVLSERERALLRRQKVGFVFQQFNLIGSVTALENVELPMRLAGIRKEERLERAKKLLSDVGLADKLRNLASQLSGGEQQRVAIARALANDPSLILADEPTGNLDSKTGEVVVRLLKELSESQGKTVIIATHNREVASVAGRVLKLRDGKLVGEEAKT